MFSPTFTFDSPARSPSLTSTTTRSSSRSVSPCSSFPNQTYTVTDLAATFQNSKLLRRDAEICYDSCEAYANTQDDDAAWAVPSKEDAEIEVSTRSYSNSGSRHGLATMTARATSPTSRRSQRQVATRRLCSSTSHRRDIEALVKRMVEREEQCEVSSTACSPPAETTETETIDAVEGEGEDEGYDSETSPRRRVESSTSEGMRRVISSGEVRRRASEMRVSGGCVSKAVRFRREGRGKW